MVCMGSLYRKAIYMTFKERMDRKVYLFIGSIFTFMVFVMFLAVNAVVNNARAAEKVPVYLENSKNTVTLRHHAVPEAGVDLNGKSQSVSVFYDRDNYRYAIEWKRKSTSITPYNPGIDDKSVWIRLKIRF